MLGNFGMDMPSAKTKLITTQHTIVKTETELEPPFPKRAQRAGWNIAENIRFTKITAPFHITVSTIRGAQR